VSRKEPVAVCNYSVAEHPAARAWRELGSDPRTPVIVETWRGMKTTKPAIYRLGFGDAESSSVFVKWFLGQSPDVERTVYEEILPRLPVTGPRYHGCIETGDASTWLFVEDVGSQRLSPSDPAQRALAARWLGTLHTRALEVGAAASLPEAGPPRYLANLHASREAIRKCLKKPILTADDRCVLDGVLAQLDYLECRWPSLERECDALPRTLTHGDFRPKNVRVRRQGAGLVINPIDWETAGWGVPVADLAPGRGRGLESQVDLEVYASMVQRVWPDLDSNLIGRMVVMGSIFRTLAAIEWSCVSLGFDEPVFLLEPIASMSSYRKRLSMFLEAAAEWLT